MLFVEAGHVPFPTGVGLGGDKRNAGKCDHANRGVNVHGSNIQGEIHGHSPFLLPGMVRSKVYTFKDRR